MISAAIMLVTAVEFATALVTIKMLWEILLCECMMKVLANPAHSFEESFSVGA